MGKQPQHCDLSKSNKFKMQKMLNSKNASALSDSSDPVFFQTLYESSTALGFKRSMHIEEGKEVTLSFFFFNFSSSYFSSAFS